MNEKSEQIIRRLRDLVPLRPLTHIEALRVAELQASRFLRLAGITEPPVPDPIITKLPRIQVERMPLGGTQAGAQWSQGRWIILINAGDSWGRQRYSLAHEFKHVLDNPFVDFLYPDAPGSDREDWIEHVSEWFAANLLMPRAWVKRAWARDGVQKTRALARLFDVSIQAMQIRLTQLDFIQPIPRCSYAPARPQTSRKEDQLGHITASIS